MLRSEPIWRDAIRGSFGSVGAIAAFLILIPLVFGAQRDVSLLSFIAIFALVAYSVNVSFRYSGVLMIAQGAVWGVGAYTAGLLSNNWGWSFWATLPAAATLAAVAAVIIGAVSLRSRGHYFLVVTFAINEFIVLAANQVGLTGGRGGLLILTRPDAIGGFTFDSPLRRYYLYAAALLLAIVLYTWIEHTAFGRRLLAVRDNEQLARSVGISVLASQLQVLAVGGAMAGVAGVLYLYQQRAVQPDLFSALLFLQVVLMIIIGGSDTRSGPFLGALLMLALPEKLGLSPIVRQITYGGLLIGIILLAPQGIAGTVHRLFRRPPDAHPSPTPVPVGVTDRLGAGDVNDNEVPS